MKRLTFLVVVAACHGSPAQHSTPDASSDGATTQPDGGSASGCPAGHPGDGCVLALYDAAAGCDATAVAAFEAEMTTRKDPLWAGGRALFSADHAVMVAGDWNGWQPTVALAPFCSTQLVLAVTEVPSGFHTYKLVDGQTWTLDPRNPAFAYDDFAGNADHQNSVLDTPDSGKGHLVKLDQACSTTLGNCRDVTAYLPPGYDADAKTYPVLFMHDGQNVWDNHTCCFGHTGWEVNVTLDSEIAAGKVKPIVVIAADNTTDRNNEYGLDDATAAKFEAFQVDELQPHALAQVRWDGNKVAIAGSSLGGLISMELALRNPSTYSAVASLSGAFWPGMDTHDALRDHFATLGKQQLAMYLDSGGAIADDSDGAADTAEIRDMAVSFGWERADSPACTPGPSALCYYIEPGATHDELAWKARAWRFLEFLYPAS
ncbi:MAG TPA: alpha/beta hydrolase-fold protein [Kofleriaceae bacterium]|nr:alpha/beta hydrolase-fold protein [Kofleriaceae bacterium]